ncbi:MAG TPA: hypothetical protein VHV47_06825 [Opitutaceae bacterium]|jgi:hypothetical protein|nr:hypothetical protein [Opitutaceae bacterium]
MKPRALALAVLLLAAPAARAWYEPGHRIVNQLALDSLPADFPAWIREPAAVERIGFLANEPDRWRRTRALLLQHDNGLDHFVELEAISAAGLDLAALTPFRYQFAAQFAAGRAAHPAAFPPVDPAKDADHSQEWPGFLPWTIAEYYAKLQSEFSYLKTYELYGTPAEIAEARANVIYTLGVMGHYVGDGSQPLHTTVHRSGWVGPNPQGYTTADFHAVVDGGFIAKAGITATTLRPRVTPAGLMNLAPRADGRDPAFVAALDYLLATRRTVEPLYRLMQQHALDDPANPAGRAFIEGRLLAGGEMLGSLWLTAWRQAAPDPVLRATLLGRSSQKN